MEYSIPRLMVWEWEMGIGPQAGKAGVVVTGHRVGKVKDEEGWEDWNISVRDR